MKRFGLLIFALLFLSAAAPARSQSGSKAQSRIDSIRALLEKRRLPDSTGVQLLNRLAEELSSDNPEKAKACADEALELARRCAYPKGIGYAQINISAALYSSGRFAEALRHSEEALRQFERIGDPNGIGLSLNGIGKARYALSDFTGALECYEKCLPIAEELGEERETAAIQHNIGMVHITRHDMPRAFECHERALAIRERQKDGSGIAYSLTAIGELRFAAGNLEEARQLYEQALKIRETLGEKSNTAYTLMAIGRVCWRRGDYDEARPYLERALALRKEIGDRSGTGYAMNALALLSQYAGDHEDALRRFIPALRIFEELREEDGIADVETNIGNVLLARRDHAGAFEHYERALLIRRRRDDSYEISGLLNNIGVIRLGMEEYDKALESFTEALRIKERLNDPPGMAETNDNIGLVLSAKRNFTEALKHHETSLQLFLEAGDKVAAANCLLSIAECYRDLGEYDEARASADRAVLFAGRTGNRETIRNAYGVIHRVCASLGDFQQAYEYMRKYATLQDSLVNETNTRSISEMRIRYKTDKQNQEIALLEKEMLLKNAERERSAEALLRRSLESGMHLQRARLAERERDIYQLDLAKKATELDLTSVGMKLKSEENNLLQHKMRLKESDTERERNFRNSLLLALGLFLAVGFIGIKRVQVKRTEATLRAEAAEYKAHAAELQALALTAESERKEKEAQKLFSESLIEAQERERKRLAAELHDGIGQELLVISSQADRGLLGSDPAAARQSLLRIETVVKSIVTDVRRISRNLRPIQLERAGITETINDTIFTVSTSTPIRFSSDIDDVDGLFEPEAEINLFRIIQEGLNNIIKHSEAAEARIEVLHEVENVRITVSDNGKGFDPEAIADNRHSFGLMGMRERVQMLRGSMDVKSAPEGGTTLQFLVPVAVRDTPEPRQTEAMT